MAKTASNLITDSLKKLGVIAAGETPSASELQDGLSALRGLIDTWSNNDLMAPSETEETFALISGQAEYTIGPGGDFDTTRPMEILGISVIDSGNLEFPLNPLKFDQWRSIGLKTTSANIPTNYYFRTDWPLGKIFVYPTPSEAKSIKLFSRKPFISITASSDEIDLPPGYYDALLYNLCLVLADEFGKAPSANIYNKADKTLKAIKGQNLSKNVPFAYTDPALRGSGRTGWTLADFLKGGG